MSRMAPGVNIEEVCKYLDKVKREKAITEQNIAGLERERDNVTAQIEEMERKRAEIETRLRREQEILTRQDKAIDHTESAYSKIIDSSRSLADFVRKEYEESQRE